MEKLKTVSVTVALRKNVLRNDTTWQQESMFPPTVGQTIFGGTALVMANLALTDQLPNDVILNVSIENKDASAFSIDDTKFFVLDGTGQQLRHVSLDEIKYGIQLQVARNWKSGNYPPPPPAIPAATIHNFRRRKRQLHDNKSGRTNGINLRHIKQQLHGYTAAGLQPARLFSGGLAIRRHLDEKSDKKLLEQARATIASWEGSYFKSQSPVVPGEDRRGGILYWTGSTRRPQPPFRVILFLTDPHGRKEEHVTFAFGPGAERIKEEIASEGSVASNQVHAQASLTNRDIIGLVKAGIGAEIIVAKIKNSSCSFDTSPAALKELKVAGVPDSVVLVMVQAPKN